MVKIFLDPGHGGSTDKKLTLQIAEFLKDILINEYIGVSVLLSRTSNQKVNLSERIDAANKWGADYFLSMHINAGNGSGLECYIYPRGGAPFNFIHQEILKQELFTIQEEKISNLHVLREPIMPALLTENGFIDYVNDVNTLKSKSLLMNIARGHANRLERAFKLTKKPTILFRVQIGAFRDKSQADSIALDAKSKGFDSIVLIQDKLYKVQIGAFSSKEDAEILANRAKNAGFSAFVYQE